MFAKNMKNSYLSMYLICQPCKVASNLSKFSAWFNTMFPGKQLIQFLANNMSYDQNFILHNCIIIFDTVQFYWKLWITNFMNKEVIANPEPQTLEKCW